MKDTFTIEEAKEATRKLRGESNSNLSFITAELLSMDLEEFDPSMQKPDPTIQLVEPLQVNEKDSALPDVFHGHNLSYGRADDGRFYYKFQSGQTGCDEQWFGVWQDDYDHYATTSFCQGIEDENYRVIQFRRK